MDAKAMKWKYAISYGKLKPGTTTGAAIEQLEKDMEKYKAEVEKAGVKLVFWGHPLGTTENVMAVYDVGTNMDNWLKIMATAPYTDTRTHFVVVH